MNDNDKDRFLDALLDNSLREYGDAEPRVGLENRVWANLRSELEHGARERRWWVLGTAVAAVTAVISIWVWMARTVPNATQATINVARLAAPVMSPPAQHASPVRQANRRPHPARPKVLNKSETGEPKLDVFPSPQPLSEQEAMLQRYVNEHREHAVLVARAQTELFKSDRQEFFRPDSGNVGKDSDHRNK
jgi:hypothetical protein